MLNKLRRMYLLYKNRCGRKNLFMVKEEEWLYMMTRAGLEVTRKNVLRSNINIHKINDAVEYLLAFGTEEDFLPADPSVKLEQPEGVKICLEMLKNERCIK